MPKKFENCVSMKGSRVRTKKLPGGKYIHICYPPGSNKPVAGYVHTKGKDK